MLSRSAEDLFWLARYMERAENIARVLDVSSRMAVLPTETGAASLHWRPAVEIGPEPAAFEAKYDQASAENVIRFMVLDAQNPSSIYAAIHAARENARAERTAISTEMWESLNATWLEIEHLDHDKLTDWGYRRFFDWIKERCHLFRGVTLGTLLQDDGFHFMRLGFFIERGDNTARILDVKYHVLLPSAEEVGGAVDYFQWGALLRSVSSFTAYRRVYRDQIEPARIAELLILSPDLPRSLRFCYDSVVDALDILAGPRRLECRRVAAELHADLKFGRIQAIFRHGLHEFLQDFIRRNNGVGGAVQSDFMMSEVILVE